MAMMFRTVSAAVFSILCLFPAAAQSPSGSAWVQGLHSRVRLIDGGLLGGRHLAGIEIALDPGFKTYWRTPGDSGLPPRFDWSKSENVAAVELRWPAPSRHEDAAGTAYVYHGRIVLPVLVTARDAGKPVHLALALDYGICNDICIPARAELSAPLSADGPHRAGIESALAAAPHPQALGAAADLAVTGVERIAGDKPAFRVMVRAPNGPRPTLFVEGPENWYVSSSPPDGTNRFTITVEQKPRDAPSQVPIRLTLVAGDRAIESEVSLDAGQRPTSP
jgi:DsbC/DsbD-like thiol-disulfide interchange protein